MNELEVNGKGRALIDGTTLTRESVEREIEAVIERLYETNDPQEADNALISLTGINKLTVSATVKMLCGYFDWYEKTDQEELRGESFLDRIMVLHDFKDRNVIERYIMLHKMYDNDLLPEALKDRPLAEQIAIATVVEDERYIITEEKWEDLINALNGAEVRRILREIKDKPPTKGSYMGHLAKDGTIYYWHQGERVFCGNLIMPNGDNEDDSIEERVYRKNRTRAVNGMGLMLD